MKLIAIFLFSLIMDSALSLPQSHHKKMRDRAKKVELINSSKTEPLSQDISKLLIKIYKELQATSHTELNKPNLSMSFYSISSPDYFMESNFFPFQRILLNRKKYRIGVNPLIFEKNIPQSALVGVMAHELVHTEDYETIGPVCVGKKLLSTRSKRKYERATDLKVIFKGLGHELLTYKKWQYKQLDQNALKLKRKEYLTPAEVSFVIDTLNRLTPSRQKQLKQKWLKDTPLSLDQFRNSIL